MDRDRLMKKRGNQKVNIVSRPPLIAPIVDPKTGVLSKVWSIWFRDLYNRTSFKGGNAIDDLDSEILSVSTTLEETVTVINENIGDNTDLINENAKSEVIKASYELNNDTNAFTDAQQEAILFNSDKRSNVDTNLHYERDKTKGTVVSSDGTNAVIPSASTLYAGLMSTLDKKKLDDFTGGTSEVGADGSDGADGFGLEYIAYRSDGSVPPAPLNTWGYNTPELDWVVDTPFLTAVLNTLWRVERKVPASIIVGGLVEVPWSAPVVIGRLGRDGEDGNDGDDGAETSTGGLSMIWAEENGNLSPSFDNNGRQYSFGNGSVGEGLIMGFSGKVTRITIKTQNITAGTVVLVKNNVNTAHSVSLVSQNKNTSSSFEESFAVGDELNFATTQGSGGRSVIMGAVLQTDGVVGSIGPRGFPGPGSEVSATETVEGVVRQMEAISLALLSEVIVVSPSVGTTPANIGSAPGLYDQDYIQRLVNLSNENKTALSTLVIDLNRSISILNAMIMNSKTSGQMTE